MNRNKTILVIVSVFFCVVAGFFFMQVRIADEGTKDPHPGMGTILSVAIVDSSIKVRPGARFPADTAPRLQMAAARNEEESGQFVLYSGTALSGLTFSLSDLQTAGGQRIAAAEIALLLAKQVKVINASDSSGVAGQWPDALVPVSAPVNLAAGQSQGFWIRVKIASDTPPGLYTGTVTVKSGTSVLSSIALELEVWNVTLPAAHTLPTLVGLDYEMIAKFEGVPLSSPAFETSVLPGYYKALRRNHAYPFFIYGARPGYQDDGTRAILDMAPFWSRIDAALQEDASSAPIGIPFTESWPVDMAEFPLASAEYQRRVRNYLAAFAAELDARGVLGRSFLYMGSSDEPKTAGQMTYIRQIADLVRQADPRLRMLQTIYAWCEDCPNGAQTQLEHPSLMWVPNIAYFDTKAMRTPKIFGSVSAMPSGWAPGVSALMKSEKRDVWWYLNAWTFLLDTAPAYPTLFVDHPGIEHRAAGWLASRNGIAGTLYWSATYWRNVSNPWAVLPSGEGGAGTAGDGVLLYPAKGSAAWTGQPAPAGPVTSIRLELLREGAEDHALLDLLRCSGGDALANGVIDQLVRSLSDFERDPAKYHQARRSIAAALSLRARKN